MPHRSARATRRFMGFPPREPLQCRQLHRSIRHPSHIRPDAGLKCYKRRAELTGRGRDEMSAGYGRPSERSSDRSPSRRTRVCDEGLVRQSDRACAAAPRYTWNHSLRRVKESSCRLPAVCNRCGRGTPGRLRDWVRIEGQESESHSLRQPSAKRSLLEASVGRPRHASVIEGCPP